MAYCAASRVTLALLALICFVIGGGAEESSRNLLNFEVSLSEASGRVEFVCDLGSGYVEESNSINIDSSELNLLEKVVVSDHSMKGLREFVCWREKLDTAVPSRTLEDLGSQIQGVLTHHLRSLLVNDGESSLPPMDQINGSEQISKKNSSAVVQSKDSGETPKNQTSDPELKKDKPANNASGTAQPKEEKSPIVDERSQPPPSPKENELFPPTKEEKKEEKEEDKDTPTDPTNQSIQHHDTDDSKYNVCEKGKNLYTRLQTYGDGTETLTLSLRNDGDGVLDVQIKTPTGLLADPSRVHLMKGEPAEKINISIVDRTVLSNEENILISSSEVECTVLINLNALGNSDSQSYFDRFSRLNMPAVVTPQMRLGVFFFILTIIGGIVIWRTWAKLRHRDTAGAGHSYQELEMSLPSNVDNSTSPYGQEKDDKSGSGDEDGWDEVWDDWEDTEAARSSSRLIPSLSAKGLAARRSNKDGWESSWED